MELSKQLIAKQADLIMELTTSLRSEFTMNKLTQQQIEDTRTSIRLLENFEFSVAPLALAGKFLAIRDLVCKEQRWRVLQESRWDRGTLHSVHLQAPTLMLETSCDATHLVLPANGLDAINTTYEWTYLRMYISMYVRMRVRTHLRTYVRRTYVRM